MIIGINGNEANVTGRVGINAYAFELLKNLSKLSEESKNDYSLIVYLKEKPLGDMPKETQNFKYKIIPGGSGWILSKLLPDLYFAKPRPDVFFSPNTYIPVTAPMSQVASIMDLGYLKFSGQFKKSDFWQLKYWSAISISTSKAIIAISNSTKEDIVRHYPRAARKVYVTTLSYDPEKFNTSISESDVRRIKNKYSIVTDYILYIGTLKPSKNIEGLVAAFALFRSKNKDLTTKLVIAGKKGWMYETIFAKVEELGLKDSVIFTDFVPEEDKPALTKGARVFVLPSFWEGFGLDALNAMACGVPVVVSNVGSLPEVVGSAGVTIDPGSIGSIEKGLEKVLLGSSVQYNSMMKAGLEQVKKFSWESTARETLKILQNVSRQNG